MNFQATHWPTKIRLNKAQKNLEIDFDDGSSIVLPAELLRVESPSAEVQGHSPSQKKIIPGRKHVGIMAIEAMGNYAIKINFDDLHDTGIFTWQYLYELGQNQQAIWQKYLAALEENGLSRDP
ncbi:MAG: DUF971 domain-containing protein [Proteobacteria bacterium]|nr:DUF971 domain-containing protein [Pseudomonadota bacterium]